VGHLIACGRRENHCGGGIVQAAGKGTMVSQIERHEIRRHFGHKRADIIAVEHLGAVAISSASRAVMASGPKPARASSIAWRASASRWPESFEAEPDRHRG
jgi:hypothetical protein